LLHTLTLHILHREKKEGSPLNNEDEKGNEISKDWKEWPFKCKKRDIDTTTLFILWVEKKKGIQATLRVLHQNALNEMDIGNYQQVRSIHHC
jgi:hypothetical protein